MQFVKPARRVHTTWIHCSASDHPSHDDVSVMRRWHKARGWSDVGYHIFIQKSGNAQPGRPMERTGAHVRGYNSGSIGICLHGLDKGKFTAAQFAMLRDLCRQINDAYGGRMRFRGHNEVAAKACPVFDYRAVLNLSADGYIIPTDDNEELEPLIALPSDDGVEFRALRIQQLANGGGPYGDIAMHSRVLLNLYLDEKRKD